VAGATSFEDLRPVDGVILQTFREAVERRDLIETDNVLDDTIYIFDSWLLLLLYHICFTTSLIFRSFLPETLHAIVLYPYLLRSLASSTGRHELIALHARTLEIDIEVHSASNRISQRISLHTSSCWGPFVVLFLPISLTLLVLTSAPSEASAMFASGLGTANSAGT